MNLKDSYGITGWSWVDTLAMQFEHPSWNGFAFKGEGQEPPLALVWVFLYLLYRLKIFVKR